MTGIDLALINQSNPLWKEYFPTWAAKLEEGNLFPPVSFSLSGAERVCVSLDMQIVLIHTFQVPQKKIESSETQL